MTKESVSGQWPSERYIYVFIVLIEYQGWNI